MPLHHLPQAAYLCLCHRPCRSCSTCRRWPVCGAAWSRPARHAFQQVKCSADEEHAGLHAQQGIWRGVLHKRLHLPPQHMLLRLRQFRALHYAAATLGSICAIPAAAAAGAATAQQRQLLPQQHVFALELADHHLQVELLVHLHPGARRSGRVNINT